MQLLKEIYRTQGMELGGRTFHREAVRGIILQQGKLLMVYSVQNGDYKFPGGGVQPDESHDDALRREIREECGARLMDIERPFGKVIEYDVPVEQDYDVFQMTSYYYLCQTDQALGEQQLDPYEAALGFRPGWVELEDALRANAAVLRAGLPGTPRWTRREVFVLGQVKNRLRHRRRMV